MVPETGSYFFADEAGSVVLHERIERQITAQTQRMKSLDAPRFPAVWAAVMFFVIYIDTTPFT